ncbi:MAG: CDP-glycerol glycerophosphotransferase family protein [Muribaculaceae bacterium]|nr:CDP-glycerol glycerophosphotransferase family protein [Muribaculaceae bacterium]
MGKFRRVKNKIRDFYRFRIYASSIRRKQRRYARSLRDKDEIRVVLFAMSVSMWKYGPLYQLIKEHPRFRPFVVIAPSPTYSKEEQKKEVEALRSYFGTQGIEYYDFDVDSATGVDVRTELNPDVLFYPQPYLTIMPPEYRFRMFYDRLLCYSPYAFWVINTEWSYNTFFHNIAWRLYYASDIHKQEASRIAVNKAKNSRVVGHLISSEFLKSSYTDIWKPQTMRKKRLIWSPHFSINEKGCLVHCSNFLWMADFMVELSKRYADEIQFTFKPHPRLLSELYKHPDWGEERANSYYEYWRNAEHSQLENGEYQDLFMTSDAMIHDCGSFIVEYLYSQNPSMYIVQSVEERLAEYNRLGQDAIKSHYIGKCEEDVERFVREIVLDGKDTMQGVRAQFYDTYLGAQKDASVAESIVDNLLKSIEQA